MTVDSPISDIYLRYSFFIFFHIHINVKCVKMFIHLSLTSVNIWCPTSLHQNICVSKLRSDLRSFKLLPLQLSFSLNELKRVVSFC